MENSHQLATESFSYSWLTDRKPPSFHNQEQEFPKNSTERDENFNFDFPLTASPSAFVHADEIFSDGHIMPVYVARSKVEALTTSYSVLGSPVSPCPSRSQFVANKSQDFLLGKWRKSSKKILQKWFGLVKPLCKTVGCSRKSSRVDDLERKVFELRSWSNSLEASPRPSSACSVDVRKTGNIVDLYGGLKRAKSWRGSPQISPNISPARYSSVSCDAENSIHEAILYCKRSIGK